MQPLLADDISRRERPSPSDLLLYAALRGCETMLDRRACPANSDCAHSEMAFERRCRFLFEGPSRAGWTPKQDAAKSAAMVWAFALVTGPLRAAFFDPSPSEGKQPFVFGAKTDLAVSADDWNCLLLHGGGFTLVRRNR